jgi:hypothetical protein
MLCRRWQKQVLHCFPLFHYFSHACSKPIRKSLMPCAIKSPLWCQKRIPPGRETLRASRSRSSRQGRRSLSLLSANHCPDGVWVSCSIFTKISAVDNADLLGVNVPRFDQSLFGENRDSSAERAGVANCSNFVGTVLQSRVAGLMLHWVKQRAQLRPARKA